MRKQGIFYNKFGQITGSRTSKPGILTEIANMKGTNVLLAPHNIDIDKYYVKDGKLEKIPVKPSPYHELNQKTHLWKLDFTKAKRGLSQEVKNSYKKTISEGYLSFQLDPASLASMSSAVIYLQTTNSSAVTWKMSDNTLQTFQSQEFIELFQDCFEYVQNARNYMEDLLTQIKLEKDPDVLLNIKWDFENFS